MALLEATGQVSIRSERDGAAGTSPRLRSTVDAVAAAKMRLRARGWFVRYTEWPSGHEVVLHRRADTAVHLVTGWWPTEAEAFGEALAMAARYEARTGAASPGPADAAPLH